MDDTTKNSISCDKSNTAANTRAAASAEFATPSFSEHVDGFGNVWLRNEQTGEWVRKDPNKSVDDHLLQALRQMMLAQSGYSVEHALRHRLSVALKFHGVPTHDDLEVWKQELSAHLQDGLEQRAEDLAGAWEESLEDLHGLVQVQEDRAVELACDLEMLTERVEALGANAGSASDDRLEAKLEPLRMQLEEQLEARFQAKLHSLEALFEAKLESLEASFEAKHQNLESRFEAKHQSLEALLEAKLQSLESKYDDMMKLAATINADVEAENVRLRMLVQSSVENSQSSIDQSRRMLETLGESVSLLRKDWENRSAATDTKMESMKKLVKDNLAKTLDRTDTVDAMYTAMRAEFLVLRKELENMSAQTLETQRDFKVETQVFHKLGAHLQAEIASIKDALHGDMEMELTPDAWDKMQTFLRKFGTKATEDDLRSFLRGFPGCNETEIQRTAAAQWPAVKAALQRLEELREKAGMSASSSSVAGGKSKKR